MNDTDTDTAVWFTPAQIAAVDQLKAEWATRSVGDTDGCWLDTLTEDEFLATSGWLYQ